jgi:hypothetical protein
MSVAFSASLSLEVSALKMSPLHLVSLSSNVQTDIQVSTESVTGKQ